MAGLIEGLTGGIQTVQNQGFNFGQYEGVIWMWLQVIFYLIIVIISVAYYYKYYVRYNKSIIVLKRSGSRGVEIVVDRAEEVVDSQGKKKLKLAKTKIGKVNLTSPALPSDFKFKNGKKDCYILEVDDNHQLQPIKVGFVQGLKAWVNKKAREELQDIKDANENLGDGHTKPVLVGQVFDDEEEYIYLKPRPQDLRAFSRMEDELIQKKYEQKNKWSNLAFPAAIGVGFIMLFLTAFFLIKGIHADASAVAGGLHDMAEAVRALS